MSNLSLTVPRYSDESITVSELSPTALRSTFPVTVLVNVTHWTSLPFTVRISSLVALSFSRYARDRWLYRVHAQ